MSRSLGVPDVSGTPASGEVGAPLATAGVEVAPASLSDEEDESGAALPVDDVGVEAAADDGVAGDEPAQAASAAHATDAMTPSEVKAGREEEVVVIDATRPCSGRATQGRERRRSFPNAHAP